MLRATVLPAPATYPADGVPFDLTMTVTPDPFTMLYADNVPMNPDRWRYFGVGVIVPATRRLQLVRVGDCGDSRELRRRLLTRGGLPSGLWRRAFKAAFPRPDGKGPIGIFDPTWEPPGGTAHFPYVRNDGTGGFYDTNEKYSNWWRWLIEDPAS